MVDWIESDVKNEKNEDTFLMNQHNLSYFLPIMLNLIAALAGAFGQYFYKIGGDRLKEVPLFLNWPLYVGGILFCGVTLLFILSYNLGGKISIVYPAYATTFVWSALIAVWLKNESYNMFTIAGTFMIILGVVIIALLSPNAE